MIANAKSIDSAILALVASPSIGGTDSNIERATQINGIPILLTITDGGCGPDGFLNPGAEGTREIGQGKRLPISAT